MNNLHALDEFFGETREVDYLLSSEVVENSLPMPKERVEESKRNNALHRASLVMLVAHFEGFVKAALAEFIEQVREAKPPSRRVPGALLELLTRERIREIASLESPGERINKTRKLFSVYGKVWDENRSIDANILSPKILTRQLSNAGPESIDSALGILEVEDAIGKIQKLVPGAETSGSSSGSNDVSVRLRAIVDTRNQIAHGNRNIAPSAVQVKSDLQFMSSVAVAISEIISERIEYCCSLR